MDMPMEQTAVFVERIAEVVKPKENWWQILAIVSTSVATISGVIFAWIKFLKSKRRGS